MDLKVYTLDQSEQWDNIVRTFKDYDTYWLSGYVKAFEIHGDGTPLLFYYEGSNTRGINVVMKRDIADDSRFQDIIPRNEYFDFSTPYGYGGWLVEVNEEEELFLQYEKWCKNNGIVSEFVRFHWIYLRKNILVRPLKKVLFIYGRDCIIVILAYVFTIKMSLQECTYFSWFVLATMVFVITTVVAIFIFLLTDLQRTRAIIRSIHQHLKQ